VSFFVECWEYDGKFHVFFKNQLSYSNWFFLVFKCFSIIVWWTYIFDIGIYEMLFVRSFDPSLHR